MDNMELAPNAGARQGGGKNIKVPLSPIGNTNRDNVQQLLRNGLGKTQPRELFSQDQDDVQKELDTLRTEHERLQHKFETTNSKCQEEDISGLQDMVDHLQAELTDREALITQFRREAMHTEDDLRVQMGKDVSGLQETIRDLELELSRQESTVSFLQKQLREAQEKYHTDVGILKDQLFQKDAELGEYRIGATQTQKELLERTQLGIDAMRENMNQRCEQDMKIIAKLKKEVIDLRDRNGRLSVSTIEDTQVTSALQAQIDELNKTNSRKAEILEEYSVRMKTLEKEIVEWKTKFEMAESTRASLEGMSERFLSQRDHAKRVTELEVRLDDSQQLVLDLKEQLRFTSGEPSSQTQNEVTRLQEMLQHSQAENQQKLEASMVDKEALWAARQEVAVLETKLANAEAQLERYMLEITQLKQEKSIPISELDSSSQNQTFDSDTFSQMKELMDENAGLKVQLAKSESQLCASKEKMDSVAKETKELSSAMTNFGAVVKEKEHLEAECQDHMATLQQMQQANEELEFEIIELKDLLSSKKEEYKARVADKAEALKTLQAENESLVLDNQTLQRDLDRVEEEKMAFEQIQNADDAKEKLLERLNAVLEENKSLISSANKREKIEEEYEYLMRTCKEQKEEIKTMQSEMEGFRYPDQQESHRLESDLAEMRQKKEKFEDQMHDLERHCGRLEKQCNELSQSNVGASDELSRLKKKNKKLDEDKEDLEAELDSVKKHHRRQIDQAHNKIEILELDRKQYEGSYQTILSDYERLKDLRHQEICNMQNEISDKEEENTKLCQEVEMLGQSLQKSNLELEEMAGQNLILESANKRLQTNIVEFENTAKKSSEQKVQTSKLLTTAEKSIEMLQNDLNQRDEEVVDLERIASQMKVESGELQKRLTTTQNDCDSLNAQYKELLDNYMKVDNRLQCEIDYTMQVNESNARLTKLLEEMQTPRQSLEGKRLSNVTTSDMESVRYYVEQYPNAKVIIESSEGKQLVKSINELIRSTECDLRAQMEVLGQQIRDLQPDAEKCDNLESDLQETSDALLVAQLDFQNTIEENKLFIQSLEKDIKELNAQILEKFDENKQLQEKLVLSQTKVEELQSSLLGSKSRETQLVAECQGLTSEIEKISDGDEQQLLETIMDLENDLDAAQKVNTQLQQEFDSYKSKMKQIVDKNQENWAEERAKLKEEMKTQENKLSLYLEENQLLEEKLSKTEQGYDELKEMLSDASPQKVSQSVQTFPLRLDASNPFYVRSKQPDVHELQRALALSQEQNILLKQVAAKYEKLKEEYDDLKDEYDCEMVDMTDENEQIRMELESQIKQGEDLHADNIRLQKEVESQQSHPLEKAKADWLSARDDRENELAQLTERAESAEEKVAEMMVKIGNLEQSGSHVEKLLERAENSERDILKLKMEISSLERNESKLESQLADERKRFEEMFSQKCALKQEVAFLTNANHRSNDTSVVSKDIDELVESANMLSSLIAVDDVSSPARDSTRPQDLLYKIARYRETVEELESQLMESNKERESLQTQLEAFKVEPTVAHRRVSNAMKLIRRLSNQNDGEETEPLQKAVEMLEHYFIRFDNILNEQQGRYSEFEKCRQRNRDLEYKLHDLTEEHSKMMNDLKVHYSLMDAQKQDLIQAIAHTSALEKENNELKRGDDREKLIQEIENLKREKHELSPRYRQIYKNTEREAEIQALRNQIEQIRTAREVERQEAHAQMEDLRSGLQQGQIELRAASSKCEELKSERESERMNIRTIRSKMESAKLFVLHIFDVFSLPSPENDDLQKLLEKMLESWTEREASFRTCHEQNRQQIHNLKHDLQGCGADAVRWQEALEAQRWEHASKWEEMEKVHKDEISNLKNQLQERNKDSGKLREDLTQSLQELSSLRYQTLSQSRELRAEEFASLQKEREFLHIQIAAFEKRALEAEKQVQKMKTTGSELERALGKDLKLRTEELEAACEMIKELQSANPNILTVKQRVDDLLTHFNVDNSEWGEDAAKKLRQLQTTLKEAREDNFSLEQQCAGLKEQVHILSTEKLQLLEDVSVLQDELAQLQAHGICLQEEVSERKHVLEVFNSLFELVNGSSTDSLEESAIYHSDNWMKTLMSTIRDLQSCLEAKLKELRWESETDMRKIQQDFETFKSQAESDLQNWESERERLQEKIERVKDKYRFQSVDMIKLRENYNEANRKLMRMENTMGHASKDTEMKDLKKEVKDLKWSLDSEKEKREHFEKKCENLEHHSARIDQSVLRTKKSLSQVELEKHELKATLHDAKLQRDQIQDQYNILKGKYDGLKKQFWTIKKRYDRMENVLRKKSTSFLQETPGSSAKKHTRSREKRV